MKCSAGQTSSVLTVSIHSSAMLLETVKSTVDLLGPAQVSTSTAGGRLSGSSLIRSFIRPDYVPHVRVHRNEQTYTA